MRVGAGCYFLAATVCTTLWIFSASGLAAQDAHFHNAPTSSSQQKNPYAGQTAAVAAGAKFYATNCGSCHGINGRGTGNIPALARGATQGAPDGEVFWFITTGSVNNGMPSWATLPEVRTMADRCLLEVSQELIERPNDPNRICQPEAGCDECSVAAGSIHRFPL